mgnify:FL=1
MINQLKNGIKTKWIKNTMDKQLDCEGIDVGDTKGKITHIETDNLIDDNYTIDDVLKIIDYIMCTCSEMDLQTKTPEEIFEEYNEKY